VASDAGNRTAAVIPRDVSFIIIIVSRTSASGIIRPTVFKDILCVAGQSQHFYQ
jgi:hypothetical protein